MFGHNEIVGQKFFKTAPKDSLFVTSSFFTLQGEGPYGGFPAYFIRLAMCNLNCSFCDTYFDTGEWKTFDELLGEADSVIERFFIERHEETPRWAKGFHKDMVLVITGGEPSLQANLSEFLERAENYFNVTQIESNGTITQEYPVDCTVVVSPKCLEKNGQAVRYLEPKPEMLERADCLKFVMRAPLYKDDPYATIPDWALNWEKRNMGKSIYVSPMNVYNRQPAQLKNLYDMRKTGDMKERSKAETISFWEPGLLDLKQNEANHAHAARYAMAHNLHLNLQMHLYAGLA